MPTRQQGKRTRWVLGRAILWIPPGLLAAMLIAGPVTASGGAPTALPGSLPHGAHASTAAAAPHAGASPCAVVVLPLPSPATGPTGAVEGAGTCLAPTPPSAPSAGAASIDPTTQTVTQSIGMEVRAGP